MNFPSGNSHFSDFSNKMEIAYSSVIAINAFKKNYESLIKGDTGLISESDIEVINNIPSCPSHQVSPNRIQELLRKTCLLKLNGGLGTSMGLDRPKSLLVVKNDLTFLDLICRQVLEHRKKCEGMAFLLMNSFNTSAETEAFITNRYPQLGSWKDIELLQGRVPKVDAATFRPAVYDKDPDLEWCPPGHGDLYAILFSGNRLKILRDRGIRYLFVSNADNLGGTLNYSLLDYFSLSGAPFLMEVTERTSSDRKGGHLCRDRITGRLRLREIAQCSQSDYEAFQNIELHQFFNTNNLWIDLDQLNTLLLKNNGLIPLPVIFNAKTVNPRDPHSAQIIQLETAMGAAIESFENAQALLVPRSRFIPVKTTNDLLVVRSDAYSLTAESTICIDSDIQKLPVIDLDPMHYKLIDQLEAKLPDGPPSLRGCNTLSVRGPTTFSPQIFLKGSVIISNQSEKEFFLPSGIYKDQELNLS